MDHSTEKEESIFLDFTDTLPNDLLQKKFFIRLAKLEDKNPLIQINDVIFKGTYDYSIGTNIFLKKSANDAPTEFPFKEPSLFKLEYIDSTTKILNCRQMKVPSTTVKLPVNQENIKFNFNWDYKELLKKFENGTLDLQDMIEKTQGTKGSAELLQSNNASQAEEMPIVVESGPYEPMDIDNTDLFDNHIIDYSEIQEIDSPTEELSDELKVAYDNLQLLARTPVKREIMHEDAVCDPKFKNEYEYRSTESKILERPLFSYIRKGSRNFNNCINLERCVTLGLLAPSNVFPRNLSNEEKNIIMTVENFENLDLTARYSILVFHMDELQKQINLNTLEQNSIRDEFDRTPIETLEMFKKLLSSLERHLQEIYYLEKTVKCNKTKLLD